MVANQSIKAVSKKKSNNRESLIYVHILKMLSRNTDLTVQSARQRLMDAHGIERSERQIQRILKQLSEQFRSIQVNSEGKPYGYRWAKSSEGFNLNDLTPMESLMLIWAKQHLESFMPPRLLSNLDSLFEVANHNLLHNDNTKLQKQWLQKIASVPLSQPLIKPKIAKTILETITDALYNNQTLIIRYKKLNGEESEREVEPYGLIQQDVRMYLACRFLKYEDPVPLAVHRIVTAQNTLRNFERKKFDIKQFDEEGKLNFGKGQLVKVTIWMQEGLSKNYLETPLSDDQTIVKVKDGGVHLTATVYDSLRLERWIQGFGEKACLVSKVLVQPVKNKSK